VDTIALGDDGAGPARRDTVFPVGHAQAGEVQRMVLADGTNKGLRRVGFERGYWDEEGKVVAGGFSPLHDDGSPWPSNKALLLDDVRTRLRQDADFERPPTLLEDTMGAYNDARATSGRACHFHMAYLPKFWCSLAWIEQYWNDCKRVTREQCDYTVPTLKATFPAALENACPVTQIRKYMQRSLDHITALAEIGRDGDFDQIPSLRKKYKGHRRAELIRFGLASEEPKRDRAAWGKMASAQLLSPEAIAEAVLAAAEAAVVRTLAADEQRAQDAQEHARRVAEVVAAAAREARIEAAAEAEAQPVAAAGADGNDDDDDDEEDEEVEFDLPVRLTQRRHCARPPGAWAARRGTSR
jgi:hypothetical protein